MAEIVSAPLTSFSERELLLICNIHGIEYKRFKPITLKHDLLFNELRNSHDKIRGRVNAQSFYNNMALNNPSAFDISYLRAIFKAECLDKSHFEWINTDNDRLCNFVWSYIKCAKEKLELVNELELYLGSSLNSNNSQFKKTLYIPQEAIIKNTYDSLGLGLGSFQDKFRFAEQNPTNNKVIKCNIMSYFDTWNVSLNEKENNIKALEHKWENVRNTDDIDSWITKKDTDKANWAWSYIHKEGAPNWFMNDAHKLDKLHGVITTFDLLNEYQDKRALLKTNMKSAWSQKAYRDKNNGKKAVSIVLPEDIIKMLDGICVKTDRRKNEVITRLIREEYDKQKK